MSNFKIATRQKYRFATSKGMLSCEQLWDLSLTDLTSSIRNAKKEAEEAELEDELSFLTNVQVIDEEAKIKFEILKEVYQTKQAENQAVRKAADDKAYNQKIMAIIAEKEEGSLKNLNVDELKSLLK